MRTALIYNFLIEANLMAAIAILLMIFVRMFGRKALGSRAIYFAWLLVAIRLLCPLALPNPAIHEIRSVFARDTAIRPIAGQIQVRFGDAVNALYNGVQNVGIGGALEEGLYDLRDDAGNGMLSIRLMKVYLAGAGLAIGWFVFGNWKFQKQLRADRIEPISGKVQAQYEALCKELGIRKPIPVYYVDPLPSACLVGCLKPYIALPLTARPQEIENVLRHELCHYRNGDHWWCLIRLVCCAVHWFNPLVWIAARMCRTDGELACDERVIRSMDEDQRRDYAGVLVLAACKRDLPGITVMSTGMSMTGRRLKKRVVSIMANHQAHKGLALGFVLLASMALVGAFATAETPLIARVPSAEMEYRAATVAASTIALTEAECEQAIETAKQFWRSEALQADVHDKLQWGVQGYKTHTEVHAFDPNWGEALVLAFAPDGRILYMNHRRSGDREATSFDDRTVDLSEADLNKLKEYGLAVLEGMDPGITEKLGELENMGATRYNDNYFYRFFAYAGEGDERELTHVFNVQAWPEVRLTHYENLAEMDDEATDRLEPGNG